jgi:predicted Zn-dependent peptidase
VTATATVTGGRVTVIGRRATATVAAYATATATLIGRAPEPDAVDQQHRLTTLESGVRIVTEAMPSVRSVSLGFWIGTGSRYETDDQAGLSHLLEHLLFKGSAKYESLEIDQIFDGMGAELNAGTGKETTSVYARVIDAHLADAFDVMADMVFRPALREIDSEREVILEEIAMYEDDPQEKVFDMLGEAVFGDDPLGRAIIGRASVISETPTADIARFHRARYRPENVVISASGAIDHDALVELARDRVGGTGGDGSALGIAAAPVRTRPARRFERKDTEQYHVCLAAPGVSRSDRRRFAASVLDAILGGSASSRLFQEIREKRGMAYSVYSFVSQYADTGQVGIYVGTREDNLGEALQIAVEQIADIASGNLPARELSRAKENLKGRLLLSMESTSARMTRLGKSIVTDTEILSLDRLLAEVDAVDADGVSALAADLLAPARLSAAGIGPSEDTFLEALERATPTLARAA